MLKTLSTILVFCLSTSILSCSDNSTESPIEPEVQYGQVAGRISDAETYKFIQGAEVGCGGQSEFTSYVGLYSFDSVRVGERLLRVDRENYATSITYIDVEEGKQTYADVGLYSLFGPLPETTFVRLYAIADTYVDANPNTKEENYGSEPCLYTGLISRGSAPNSLFHAFIKFDISGIPASSDVIEAKLFLVDSYNSTPVPQDVVATVTVSEVLTKNWFEHSLTYSNAPSTHRYLSAYDVIFDARTSEHRFDVKEAVVAWTSGDRPNYGFSLASRDIRYNGEPSWEHCAFLSREAGSAAVALEITYVTEP